MNRRLAVSIALIGMTLAAAAHGAPASPTPPPERASARATATTRARATATTRAQATAPTRPQAAAPAPIPGAGARTGVAPRRLDDIHIEGEIPVPQVLFITARDQRRFVDFRHRRYLRTSRKVGEETVFPSWIATVGDASTASGKESQP